MQEEELAQLIEDLQALVDKGLVEVRLVGDELEYRVVEDSDEPAVCGRQD